MNRTVSLGVLVIPLVLAGCSGQITDPDCSRTRGGALAGSVVDAPPADATVVSSDRLPDDAKLLRQTLTESRSTNGTATVDLTAAETCRVRETLGEFPRTDGDRFGCYVRHDGVVVRLTIEYDT